MNHQGHNKRQKGQNGLPFTASDPGPDQSGATIHRQDASQNAPGRKQSIRLTVKAPPSKLRQALHEGDASTTTREDLDASESEPPVRNARSTRNPRKIVDPESDEELSEQDDGNGESRAESSQDDDNDDDDDDEDEDDDDDDDDNDEDDEDDAEGEDDDIDAQLLAAEDSEDNPRNNDKARGRTTIGSGMATVVATTTPRPTKTGAKGTVPAAFKSVEELEDESEGAMSDLGSDNEGQDVGDPDDDLDDDMDLDGDQDETGSRSATPDPNKLTRRQRAAHEEELDGSLLALSNEAQKRKHITAEEHATRRLEMARRRKNLSEKKNEEEKMDTINKLLSKPSIKRKTRAELMAMAAASGEGNKDGEANSADPLLVRWINNRQGSRIGVPKAWLEGPIGELLAQGWHPPPEVKLIEEMA